MYKNDSIREMYANYVKKCRNGCHACKTTQTNVETVWFDEDWNLTDLTWKPWVYPQKRIMCPCWKVTAQTEPMPFEDFVEECFGQSPTNIVIDEPR